MPRDTEPAGRHGADVPRGDRDLFDTSVAHSARVHDYWLGGKDNYAADRAAGDAMTASAIAVSELGTSRASWRLRSGPPKNLRSAVLR
jgi:S-adenosyl methyltransferase